MRIVIDAGHGGDDPGACYQGWEEKDITLDWHRLLQRTFDAEWGDLGVVFETRWDDRAVSLPDRAKQGDYGDCFLSVHVNSHGGAADTARGFEIFHYPGSLAGRDLAEKICDAWPGEYNRGVKAAQFYVLKHTACPAVLLELGFINNQWDMDLLTDLRFALEATEAIIKAAGEWHDQ